MHVPYHVNNNLNGFKTPEYIMQAIEFTSTRWDDTHSRTLQGLV
jgi:hypothetical protein